jgi:hypothetical protein
MRGAIIFFFFFFIHSTSYEINDEAEKLNKKEKILIEQVFLLVMKNARLTWEN